MKTADTPRTLVTRTMQQGYGSMVSNAEAREAAIAGAKAEQRKIDDLKQEMESHFAARDLHIKAASETGMGPKAISDALGFMSDTNVRAILKVFRGPRQPTKTSEAS